MFFTDNKTETLRVARAEALIMMAPLTLKRVMDKTTPKGDVLELARTAGVLAAKKTPELIPYCHPLPLDGVRVDFEIGDNQIKIVSLVKTIWKTGVEMEALTAVTVSALTIYDMLKPIDKNMEITGIRLTEKKGGKSSFKESVAPSFKTAVIVTSDGTFNGKREDNSGKVILEKLKEWEIRDVDYLVLPDEEKQIAEKLNDYHERGFSLVITTGGTGLGPRDVTVEATRGVMDREIPGIAEYVRSYGQRRTPYAMLSRGLVGQKGKMIIVNLPGSSNGAREGMEALFPYILHAYPMMAGGGH